MYKPILSIIVSVYNMEKYLNECIDSILVQTYESYELILVDDGSTDSSSQICDQYVEDGRVKVIHKINGGIISARKAGVEVASGEYIGFVDSDDWIERDMFFILMQNAYNYNADMVSCGYYLDDNDSRRIVGASKEIKVIKNVGENKSFLKGILSIGFDWVSSRNITPSVCNKIFRKKLLEHVYREIDERIIWDEDTVTVLSTVMNSECIVLIPDILYHYRNNMTSVSHCMNRSILQNYVYTFDALDKLSREHGGILDDQIPYFSLTAARMALDVGFGVESSKHYVFPFGEIAFGSRIIIYGAGQVGRCYYRELNSINYASQLSITDSDSQKWKGDVVSPGEALKNEYDFVVIAVENEIIANKIRTMLIEKEVSEKKLFWQKPKILKDTYAFYASHIN